MLYFVCFIFGILLFLIICNDFIVDLFTENKEIVIIITKIRKPTKQVKMFNKYLDK